jgi:hypothetical protein
MPKPLNVQKALQGTLTQQKKREESVNRNKRARPTKQPLAGKVIAVSTLTQGDSSVESSGTVIELCKAAGAQYTAQVHRKVYCLVASSSAVRGSTQRVRKAWRRRIPIVTIDWVKQCVETGKLLDMDEFRIEEKPESKECDKAVASDSSVADAVIEERTIELGCCCVCHELDDAMNCEWCTDCVVNR